AGILRSVLSSFTTTSPSDIYPLSLHDALPILQASVANTISSMRRVSATEWSDFVERHSTVETLLRTDPAGVYPNMDFATRDRYRSEEHTSELQSLRHLVCRLLLEKKKSRTSTT